MNEKKKPGRPRKNKITVDAHGYTVEIESVGASGASIDPTKEVTLETVRRVEAMIGRSHVAWAYVNPVELVKACREVEV